MIFRYHFLINGWSTVALKSFITLSINDIKYCSVKFQKWAQRLILFKEDSFLGLIIFWGSYIRNLNVKTEKRICQQVRSYYSYKLCLLLELRDTNCLIYQKIKRYKNLHYSLHSSVNKHTLFWQGSEGVCIPLCGNPF